MTSYAMLTNGEMVVCPDDTYTSCAACEHADICVTRGDDVCDVCGETGDKTCFDGSGICATENECIVELCDYCDNPATDTCPLCDATICDNHVEHEPQTRVDTGWRFGSGTCAKSTRETVDEFDNEIETWLSRYINNRNKRTNDTWHVVERYTTSMYNRAVIENTTGTERVRLFCDVWNWRAS